MLDDSKTAENPELNSASSAKGSKSWLVPFIAVAFGMMVLQMAGFGFTPLLPAIKDAFKMSYTQLGLFAGDRKSVV